MNFFKKYWLKIGIFLLLVLPLMSFALVSLSIFIFIYWPSSFSKMDFALYQTEQKHLVVLAHGVKDDAKGWGIPLKNALQQQTFDGEVFAVDWSPYAQNTLTCAIEGKRIGHLLGEQLSQNLNLTSVHLIGHSCGAFVIYGACEILKHKRQSPITVQTTYLDPVSVYGILWNYGIKHFGSCADYSEAYIDTGDTIPGSNQLLPHTRTYDVTAVRQQRNVDINPHLWPVAYYRELVDNRIAPELHRDKSLPARKPAGELEQVLE